MKQLKLWWKKRTARRDRVKLLLAFEYGVVLSGAAKDRGVELDKWMVEKAEKMLLNEFERVDTTQIAVDMIPNILSVFETDMVK